MVILPITVLLKIIFASHPKIASYLHEEVIKPTMGVNVVTVKSSDY